MAQARDKRRQRSKQRRTAPSGPSPATARQTSRTRRLVIAFLVILAVAGILAVGSPDDGGGAPIDPGTAGGVAR